MWPFDLFCPSPSPDALERIEHQLAHQTAVLHEILQASVTDPAKIEQATARLKAAAEGLTAATKAVSPT